MTTFDHPPVLRLRPPRPLDADALAAAIALSHPQVSAWMDWCGPDYDRGSALSWIETVSRAREQGEAFEWLIVGADGALLGCCGLNDIDAINRRANLGYWVRSDATGRGVARAAVRQLLEFAFTATDLERLEIVVAKDNAASIAVAVAVGAEREGLQRRRLCIHGAFHDAFMFAALRPLVAEGGRD